MELPRITGELLVLAAILGWILLWGVVAWLNHSVGDPIGTFLTLVVFLFGGIVLFISRAAGLRRDLQA